MSCAVLSPLSSLQERWTSPGLFTVIALSACTAPLLSVGNVTLTGDRLLGAAAVIAVAVMAITRSLHWTAIHSAVAAFAAIQMLTSLAAVSTWPAGPRFATVYVFGFASFALAAELAARARDPWTGARVWIAVGAVLGLAGAGVAFIANFRQVDLWGSGHAATVGAAGCVQLVLYAAKLTFGEWNLYSSFLLVAFALSLWWWRSGAAPPWRYGSAPVAMSAIVLGLVFGATRAAWIGMAALIALWAWARRPSWRAIGSLAAVVIAGFAAQAAAIGQTPLYARVVQPVQRGLDRNVEIRRLINDATLESWRGAPSRVESGPPAGLSPPPRERDECQKAAAPAPAEVRADRDATKPAPEPPTTPRRDRTRSRWQRQVFGNGAGSINALWIVPPGEAALEKPWNGNALLFVLHDSGAIGLASLAGLVVAVALVARGALRRTADMSVRALVVGLLGAGVALLFAYQFTHALWLMYPYVYLGLLSTALARTSPGADVRALR